ncbi:MAG TPA: hypothetical protein VKO61_01135, partial [Candidatus Paceibacterota bacterium]|nr:hypothetical protein [Candidatus Paceibacterota bacterium]
MKTKIIKILSLSVFTVFASLLTFYFLNQALITGTISGLWPAIVSFLVFVSLITLEVLFIADFKVLMLLTFVETMVPIFVFQFDNFQFLFWIFILFFLFVYWGEEKGLIVLKNSVEIKFVQIAKEIIPKIVTGLLIFLVFLLYFHYVSMGHFDKNVAKRTFDKVLNSFNPALKIWVPDASFDMTVNELLNKLALTELERSKIDLLKQNINLAELSDQEKQALIADTVKSFKEKFENNLGEIKENQTVRSKLFGVLNDKISNLPAVAKKISGGGFLLIIFFILKSLALLLYPLIEFIAFILYKSLLALNFANVD